MRCQKPTWSSRPLWNPWRPNKSCSKPWNKWCHQSLRARHQHVLLVGHRRGERMSAPRACCRLALFQSSTPHGPCGSHPALQTDSALGPHAMDTLTSWGKFPALVQDTPGFIVNRVARPFYSEAIRILEEGLASVEDIDASMKDLGFRMGPFELMDLIGHDVNYAVTSTVHAAFFGDPRYRPSHTQRQLVAANWLGRKKGDAGSMHTTPKENTTPQDKWWKASASAS